MRVGFLLPCISLVYFWGTCCLFFFISIYKLLFTDKKKKDNTLTNAKKRGVYVVHQEDIKCAKMLK